MMDDTGNIEPPNISMSELLFPAFNSLVPQFFENVVPYISEKNRNKGDCEILVTTLHQLLGFAFKTQVFNKIIWRQV
jgi:hypothetical protein